MIKREKIKKFLSIYYKVLLFSFVIVVILNILLLNNVCYEEVMPQDNYWSEMFPVEYSINGCKLLTSEEIHAKETFYQKKLWLTGILIILMIVCNQLTRIKTKKFKGEK